MAGLIRHVCWSGGIFRCNGLLQPMQNVRPFHCSTLLSDLKSDFDDALYSRKDGLNLDDSLKLFALRRQATKGPCSIDIAGKNVDPTQKQRWEAWTALGGMSKDEAMKGYIELADKYICIPKGTLRKDIIRGLDNIVDELARQEAAKARQEAAEAHYYATREIYEGLKVEERDKMFIITLNTPEKKNALDFKLYDEWTRALQQAGRSDASVAVITGAGDYYSTWSDEKTKPENEKEIVKKFVKAFNDLHIPLIAVVNGPAVGLSVTTLGLCDAVYATEKATFQTPFTELGQAPDPISTSTFPKIMGYAKANEMILFGKKITAKEACELGLVNEVFPDKTFQKEVWDKVKDIAQLPKKSLSASKCIIHKPDMKKMEKEGILAELFKFFKK